MRRSLRTLVTGFATGRHLAVLHRHLMDGSVAIFMLHRFKAEAHESEGHPPEMLDRFLAWLRRRGIRIWSLVDLVEALRAGEKLEEGGVCFTVDDGYSDFASVGMDVFARYDVPVTVFLPTSFIDGERWMWWDKVDHILSRTSASSVPLPPIGEGEARRPVRWPLTTEEEVRAAGKALMVRLERLEGRGLDEALASVAASLDVDLPGDPPPPYRPLTWDQVHECAARGATFGPHSRTHLRLSRASDHEAEEEIAGSWERLQAELPGAIPIFCYPYGVSDSFGEREEDIVRRAGLDAGLSSEPDMIDVRNGHRPLDRLYRLPRFGFSNDTLESRQVATGIFRLRTLLFDAGG